MLRWVVLALACALVSPASAAAASTTEADWLKPPTPEDLMAVFPRGALQKGLGGKALLACQVSPQGALFDCSVVSESPAGAGFGGAAIALTPQMLMKPATRDGKPVVGAVRLPINFKAPDAPTGSHLASVGPALTRSSLSGVRWRLAPTYDEVVAAYPPKARAKLIGGRATLNCTFKPGGRVGSCDTIAETPKGQGFAAAAKALAARFVGPETLDNGATTVGVYTQISFVFATDMLDPQKRLIGKPMWSALPRGEDVAAGYPMSARQAGVRTARVIIRCDVAGEGRLAGCAMESEEPAGLGFGDSALALSKAFRVQPWSDEGLPTVGGQIRIPIRFQLPDQPPGAAK